MKSHFSVLVIAILIFAPAILWGQGKYAHINKQLLLKEMPGYQTAKDSLDAFFAALQSDYHEANTEYDQLLQQGATKDEKKMQELIAQIIYFEDNNEYLYLEKEAELFAPLRLQIENAISEVVLECHFDKVIDASLGIEAILKNSEDIMLLVKKKLGLND